MSTTTHAPVIVVTEEKKRRKGMIWLAGGAALAVAAVGGGTFALWSDSAAFDGGTITAGDLDLASTAPTAFYDVSADRTDATTTIKGTDGTQAGHTIDDASWRIVPGDKVAAAFSAGVTLEGDNLVAKLSASGMESVVDGGNASLTWTFEVYADGDLVVSESDLPADAKATLMYLSASAVGQAAGAEDATGTFPVDGVEAAENVFPIDSIIPDATTVDFTVVIYGTFDADADGQTSALSVEDLGALTLDLEQVRDTGAIFG